MITLEHNCLSAVSSLGRTRIEDGRNPICIAAIEFRVVACKPAKAHTDEMGIGGVSRSDYLGHGLLPLDAAIPIFVRNLIDDVMINTFAKPKMR